MYAVLNRADGTLETVQGFEHEISTDSRTFFFDGTINGITRSNYHIECNKELDNIVCDLPAYVPALYGQYAGLSVRDGVLELAVTDIGGVAEIYYGTTETEIVVSNDFFDFARVVGHLNYDARELLYFIRHGFCHRGKTTFDGVYRLPPGDALKLNPDCAAVAQGYLNEFKGTPVTFDVFKNALTHSIGSIIQNDPCWDEVIMYSGGADSSVLLSLVNKIKDVTVITYRLVPALSWNEPEVIESERMARKMQVPQEVVEVDLNEIPLSYLNDVIESAPFAAHLSISFKKLFEVVYNRNKRLWSGQNLDNLYSYTMTHPLKVVNRFLLSAGYVRMLNGVEGYERYKLIKKPLDFFIRRLLGFFYKQRLQTPDTVDELIEYFQDSDHMTLALRIIGGPDGAQADKLQPSKHISTREIRRTLFDEQLGCYLMDKDHRAQLQGRRLHNIETALPYSTPNLVHLFRALDLSVLDVLFAKRFMYRYARELGLPKLKLDVSRDLCALVFARKDIDRGWLTPFETTDFGRALNKKAIDLAIQMRLGVAKKANMTDAASLQKKLGILWLGNVHESLIQHGVELEWPRFTET
jgi:hypothetical protein